MAGSTKDNVTKALNTMRPTNIETIVDKQYDSYLKPKRGLTTREKIILMEGSKLNGNVFPPWTNPSPSEFEMPRYEDARDLSIGDEQSESFDGWRRPVGDLRKSSHEDDSAPVMTAREPIDLVQDITTDCSVVASLCAISARLAAGRSDVKARLGGLTTCQVILCNLFPQDESLRQPVLSINGKYMIRLYFNGCLRKVVIDDRLPASRTARALHVTDRNNPGLLWPSLIEKAYLTVRGGYDFPGSNSGTDLWVLTGWIPEQLFIQSNDTVRSALWRRLFAAFNYGDVLITMGTGKLTLKEEEGLGLAGEHDYAVLDLKEHKGQQFFLMKNPWSEGTIWKGHNAMTELSEEFDTHTTVDRVNQSHLAPGSFWMTLNDVFQSFDSIYLNWNPELFPYKEEIHFRWDLSTCSSVQGSFTQNPQFTLISQAGDTVWLLLSRHFTSTHNASRQGQKTFDLEGHEPGFMSLYAFEDREERVICSDGATSRSPYVDSPNTLLKLDLSNSGKFTIAVSEQGFPRVQSNFTLSAFSFTPTSLYEAHERFTHTTLLNGSWTASTAGGNAGGPTYEVNPQYSLKVGQTSDLCILLETTMECLPIHLKLIWAKGKQVRSITSRDVVGDSGEYRKGFAFVTMRSVQANTYTIVCSTFERGQLGDFKLQVKSVSACSLARIAVASAGRFITKTHLAVFRTDISRISARLNSQRLNRVCMTARFHDDYSKCDVSARSPLKLLLEHGLGTSKQTLGTSGDHLNSHSGVHCSEIIVDPSMCAGRGVWIVVERLICSGVQNDEFIDVELWSDEPIEVHEWSTGAE
ncbi:cysteine protease [Lecanora helva]